MQRDAEKRTRQIDWPHGDNMDLVDMSFICHHTRRSSGNAHLGDVFPGSSGETKPREVKLIILNKGNWVYMYT